MGAIGQNAAALFENCVIRLCAMEVGPTRKKRGGSVPSATKVTEYTPTYLQLTSGDRRPNADLVSSRGDATMDARRPCAACCRVHLAVQSRSMLPFTNLGVLKEDFECTCCALKELPRSGQSGDSRASHCASTHHCIWLQSRSSVVMACGSPFTNLGVLKERL